MLEFERGRRKAYAEIAEMIERGTVVSLRQFAHDLRAVAGVPEPVVEKPKKKQCPVCKSTNPSCYMVCNWGGCPDGRSWEYV